jgi:hypothetical protein
MKPFAALCVPMYRSMRRSIHFLAIACCVLASAASLPAQDAHKIIDEYVKAAGGSKALSSIQTLSVEGVFAAGDDRKSGAYTFDIKFPNRYYSELTIGEQSSIQAYNGKSAWGQQTPGAIATILGTDAVQVEAAAQYYNSHLINLKKNNMGATFIGHAQVGGRDALQVEVTSPKGLKIEIFFDPQTHLILKGSMTIAGMNEETLYDDYRPVNGVKLPYKIELHRGKEIYPIAVTRVAINTAIGERLFDFPSKSQVALPDLKALFKEIDDNQKAIDKIKENYAGTRVEEETEYDGNGQEKKQELREYSFFYLDGEEVSTLQKKDGKPLSEDEQKKEDERVKKRIQELQNRQAKKEAKEAKEKEKGKDDEDVSIESFLHACQFVNPRRERFRGQDVLVFDFEPNPEYKPRNLTENILQKLAGVIWVDEKAHDVVRLEAYFADTAKIGGGVVASVQKGTNFVFEQAYVNNEVWLPTYDEVHANVRVLLVKGFKSSEVDRYSDYKKFNVHTLSTVAPPKKQQ